MDWTDGSLRIRAGKPSRERVLPIAEDTGAALARQLDDGRPVSTERAAFLGSRPSHPVLRGNGFIAMLSRLLKKGFQVPEIAPFGVRSDVESISCET